MPDELLTIIDLKKNFRSHWTFRKIEAVRGVSLGIRRGESFGFLGPNGAGKTTTIKCVVGLIQINAGTILLNGEKLASAAQHRIIGYLPEQPYFYDHLTVDETLDFFSQLHGLPQNARQSRIEECLNLVGLADRKHSAVRALSKGLQQRLGFAQAILNRPELLILDEPFSGLDPIGRAEFRRLILSLNRAGTTIFMSSHILSDVEDICSRVAILSKGELKALFALSEMPKLFGESFQLEVEKLDSQPEIAGKLSAMAKSAVIQDALGGSRHIFVFDQYGFAQAALKLLTEQSIPILNFTSTSPGLEDVFLKITHPSMEQSQT